jgi:hypothetical protein
MALRIFRQAGACGIEMSVFANAGKDIEHFAAWRGRMFNAIGGEEREAKMFG